MEKLKKNFFASCFQFPNGRYLSLDENSKYTFNIYAENEEDAWMQLAEIEQVDSELPLYDRWNVYEVN